MAASASAYQFDVDMDEPRFIARLTPGPRLPAMLDPHELVRGLIRGRLPRQYPPLLLRAVNLRLREELERAERALRRPEPVSLAAIGVRAGTISGWYTDDPRPAAYLRFTGMLDGWAVGMSSSSSGGGPCRTWRFNPWPARKLGAQRAG
jgi:anti-sigma factor RsiW